MSVHRVKKLYEDFREEKVTRARKIRLKIPRVVAVMGYCDFIAYRTTRSGISERYKHTFHKGSMPLLCTDGKRVYLIGGRYKVTERGITDLTPGGRELE